VTGPVSESDVSAEGGASTPSSAEVVDLMPSRVADVAGLTVRRALPQRARRTIGAWCFLDHMGPATAAPDRGIRIGPHPHMGLQTVTWLVSGEILHRDSLGTEQLIRAGQLNLMTAGGGVAHAEESTSTFQGVVQGVQLWVAQPEATRHASAAFEHHAELPRQELDYGVATVLIGTFGEATSPARRDSDHVGVDLELAAGSSLLPLTSEFEYGIVVLDGAVTIGSQVITPGNLAYLGLGHQELALTATSPTRAMMIGGVPFPDRLLMWWNFVGRTRAEITAAFQQWQAGDDRFGEVHSDLARITADPPFWLSATSEPSRHRPSDAQDGPIE
jgi:redox-sensitive bicupin YhaK (pirin superfamily)